jgi:hypothetical protein
MDSRCERQRRILQDSVARSNDSAECKLEGAGASPMSKGKMVADKDY